MKRARFRFHGALRDFLPPGAGTEWLDYSYRGDPSLKHAIETFGVPHPEVGSPQDLHRPVVEGEEVDVRPRDFTAPPGGEWRFVLDCHLGRLVKYLRILGFDTLYQREARDEWLADVSASEGRMLLTMDRGLLQRSIVEHGCLVRAADPRRQLLEVVARFGLAGRFHPLRRCLRCNATLDPVAKEEVLHRIPPKTRAWCEEYLRCSGCGHLYWAGSHHDRMLDWIAAIRRELETGIAPAQ